MTRPLDILALSFREINIPLRAEWATRLCGIYLLVRNGRIFYIGQSVDVIGRVNFQRIRYAGFHPVKRAFWYPIPQGCLKYYEGALIRSLRPDFNLSAPPHFGYDNEILEGFGLQAHADEYENNRDWLKQQDLRHKDERADAAARHAEWLARRPEEKSDAEPVQ